MLLQSCTSQALEDWGCLKTEMRNNVFTGSKAVFKHLASLHIAVMRQGPQRWAPLPLSQHAERNPDLDNSWSTPLSLNSSLSEDKFKRPEFSVFFGEHHATVLRENGQEKDQGVYCSCSVPQHSSFKPLEGSDSHSRSSRLKW